MVRCAAQHNMACAHANQLRLVYDRPTGPNGEDVDDDAVDDWDIVSAPPKLTTMAFKRWIVKWAYGLTSAEALSEMDTAEALPPTADEDGLPLPPEPREVVLDALSRSWKAIDHARWASDDPGTPRWDDWTGGLGWDDVFYDSADDEEEGEGGEEAQE